MITAFALTPTRLSPEGAQNTLMATIEAAGVTSFEVHLQRVDVTGYYFSVSCEDTEANLVAMRALFGELNVAAGDQPLSSPSMHVREVNTPFGPWPVAGSEGKFARQHPSPANASRRTV